MPARQSSRLSMRKLVRQSLVQEARIDREIDAQTELYRGRMRDLYQSTSRLERPIAVLAEGDSWLKYIVGRAFAWYLQQDARIELCNLAWPGDEARDILSEAQRLRLIRELRRGPARRHKYDALIISAGGNDLVGQNRFRLWLHDYEPGMCARDVIDRGSLKVALDYLDLRLREIIALRDTHSPQTHLYFNEYDFAIPNGVGVCGRGPWLQPGLKTRRVPAKLRADVVAQFLKMFRRRLLRIVRKQHKVSVVHTQGLLGPTDWANEIHPKNSGFRSIAGVFAQEIKKDFGA